MASSVMVDERIVTQTLIRDSTTHIRFDAAIRRYGISLQRYKKAVPHLAESL
jgi:hypothetical protein